MTRTVRAAASVSSFSSTVGPDASTAIASRVAVAVGALALALLPAGRPAFAKPADLFTFAAAGYYTLDPASLFGPTEERVALACLEGLTVVDPASGEVRPGAASRWEESADGRTWTFHLRPESVWVKKWGDSYKDLGRVTAQHFVDSWMRLLHPDTRSPNSHALDALPEARVLSTDAIRADRLYRLAQALLDLLKDKPGISGADVINEFLDKPDLEARRWLPGVADAALAPLLVWKERDPMEPAKVKRYAELIKTDAKRVRDRYDTTLGCIGSDRGFVWAKDDETLVVRVPGRSPWLPSLFARAALLPTYTPVIERKRDRAFESENFVGNGAYVSRGPTRTRTSLGEVNTFKVELEKNPKYWDAASVPTARVHGWSDLGGTEALRKYGRGEVQWITTGALGPDLTKQARASKTAAPKDGPFKDLGGDVYEMSGRGVFLLRFRCDRAPLDDVKVRRALVATIDRGAMLARLGAAAPAPITRLVSARVAGAASTVSAPTWPAADAKKMFGKASFGDWFTLYSSSDEAPQIAAAALTKQWKTAFGVEVTNTTAPAFDPGGTESLDDRVRGGGWHGVLAYWVPDYDDPLAYLSAFETGDPNGATGWSNVTYDALVGGARDVDGVVASWPVPGLVGLDEVKRLAEAAKASGAAADRDALRLRLLHEAELLVLSEAVVVPLWVEVSAGLVKDRVRGLTIGASKRSVLDVMPLTRVSLDE